MITIINRKLDKLRLIRTYPTKYWKQEWKESLGVAKDFVKSGELKQITGKYRTVFWKAYEGKDEPTGLRIAFGSSKNGFIIAIDFTPSKLTSDEWADVKGYFDSIVGVGTVWTDFRIQVMELAMDVKRPMSDFVFIAPALRSSYTPLLKYGTLYLGAKYGQRSFCIYDKQKQLKEVKKKSIPHPLTRIESRRRGGQVTLSKLLQVQNPFSSLLVVPRDRLDKIKKHHPTDTVFLTFRANIVKGMTGHDAYWEHDAEERKRIVKLLRPHALKLDGSNKHWTQWVTKQLAYLAQNFNDS